MKVMKVVVSCAALVALLINGATASAQEFRGRLNGTVTDNTGAILPGVTVTVSSPALIQPQVQVTGADGGYRFLALPPGMYEVDFDLTGFQRVQRKDVRVVINQTLTVDMQMQVATLQETVTVTGDSPIVDTTTNAMGTNFTKELLTEIPNARPFEQIIKTPLQSPPYTGSSTLQRKYTVIVCRNDQPAIILGCSAKRLEFPRQF